MTNTNLTTAHKIAQLIYYFTGAVSVFLLLRLMFKAFGANPASGIVQMVYGFTNALLIPFQGIFAPTVAGQNVIEPAILVALLIYSLLARGIVELMYILVKRGRSVEVIE